MDPSIPALLDRLPDGVLLCAPDRRIEYANSSLRPTEAIGLDLVEWLATSLGAPASTLESLARASDEVAAGWRDSFDAEIDAAADRRRILAHGVAIQLGDERHLLVRLLDITAHHRAERALEDRLHLLQTIIDAIPSPIFHKDRDGVYRGCNKAFEAYIGLPAAKVIGSTVYDVAPRDLADKYFEMDNALMQKRGTQVYEHGVRYADQSIHEVVFHKATFGGDDDGVAGLVGVMLDITERKRAEEKTRQAALETEKAMRLKSSFLAMVSHEIRTPLTGALGMIELLGRTELSDEQRRLLTFARDAADHLHRLLDNVLDFSKLEAERVELVATDFAIGELVAAAVEAMGAPARAKGIALAHRVGDGVPAAARGDVVRLRQVLFNLVSNAAKFTDRGSIEVSVGLAERAHDPERVALRFEVRDTGAGVPEEAKGRLFHEFVQAEDSTARRYGGTGLGLAIAKKLIERMGGEIGFESELGKGTTFWFEVVLARAEGDARSDERAPLRPTAPLQVLVVDDNHVNQLVAVGMLQALGHSARVVSRGEDALLAIERENFDLVLLDVEMPGMDGYATARAIRALPSPRCSVPLLAVTAHSLEETRERCIEADMGGCLIKPIRVDRLASEIAVCVGVKTLPAEAMSGPRSIAPGEETIDRERRDELERLMGRAGLRSVLEEFLAALPRYLSDLGHALADDPRAGFLYAHALKGMSEQIGATRLAKDAKRWEVALRAGETGGLSFEELEREADSARRAVELIIAALAAGDRRAAG